MIVYVDATINQGQKVEAVNLLGEKIEMEAESDNETIFAVDPDPKGNNLKWQITLRDVGPQQRNPNELLSILGKSAEWWGVHALGLPPETVRNWWKNWGTVSQAQIAPVRASILAHLPLTLLQINVRDHEDLKKALQKAQNAQRWREQASHYDVNKALRHEKNALDNLSSLIQKNEDNQRFILRRVRDLMKRYGYREDSVLLELIQNADDALSQAAEMPGASPGPEALKVRIQLQ